MKSISCLKIILWCFVLEITVEGSLPRFNRTDRTDILALAKDKSILISDELVHKITREAEDWHWTPWHPTRVLIDGNVVVQQDCVEGNSVENFPSGWLTDDQLRKGGFLIYLFFGIYALTLLAYVCNDYFIPCVELICEDLEIPEHVAAATFMAVATSCPEFFVSTISIFISESDMGIGNIIGSALFNALGVAAVGSFAAIRPIKLESKPVTRDAIIYLMTVGVLVAIVWDSQVVWYEATALAVLYVLYFVFMFNSVRIFNFIDGLFRRGDSIDLVKENGKVNEGFDATPETRTTPNTDQEKNQIEQTDKDIDVSTKPKLLRYPSDKSVLRQIWWCYVWPLKCVLTLTIPSPKTYRKFYPISFFMSICWIGGNSYIVSWMMTVIGNTLLIPDSVMGMTLLAFGGCLPEACSIFIMSRKGLGGIGVSNALGANTLAVLFALGLPWFIRSMVLLVEGNNGTIIINSSGIDYIIITLFLAVCTLWIVLKIIKFTLRKRYGIVFALCYLTFITVAILIEMGIILSDGIQVC